MATEDEIRAEIEELGRLTPEQEDILYNITLKQDELGRQSTNMLLDKVKDSPIYQPMIDREPYTHCIRPSACSPANAALYEKTRAQGSGSHREAKRKDALRNARSSRELPQD